MRGTGPLRRAGLGGQEKLGLDSRREDVSSGPAKTPSENAFPSSRVLAMNRGSSSLKVALYSFGAGDRPTLTLTGKVDRIGQPEASLVVNDAGDGPANDAESRRLPATARRPAICSTGSNSDSAWASWPPSVTGSCTAVSDIRRPHGSRPSCSTSCGASVLSIPIICR